MRLAEKYRPKRLVEVIGQREAVSAILNWLAGWKKGTALLLTGPPGVGKTAAIHALAAEKNLELLEAGPEDNIEYIMPAVAQRGLLLRRRLVVVESAEHFSQAQLTGLVRASAFPVLLVADDIWSPRMRNVRQLCEVVNFRKLPTFAITDRLAKVAREEELRPSVPVAAFAELSGGDMRAALIDLDSGLASRDRGSNVFEALRAIFRGPPATARAVLENCDMEPAALMWWIEENISAEYPDPQERAQAFELLSRLNLARHRTRTHAQMLAGFSLIHKGRSARFTSYHQPRQQASGDMELCAQIAAASHCSKRKAGRELLIIRRFVR